MAAPHLFAPEHRDACGVGFVASRGAVASHELVATAVSCLRRLDHRGARSADGSGDGAGLMTRIPHRLLAAALADQGLDPPAPGRLGVLMVFLPPRRAEVSRAAVAATLALQDVRLLTWRRVPVSPSVLGGWARATMPRIEQALAVAGPSVPDEDEFERRLLLARKEVARVYDAELAAGIASSSCRTVVYKGMFTAARIADFYADFRDPAFVSDFAVFHQRYSTNTFPTWTLAQPFRLLAHNGEINTIRSNRAWMAAREADARAEVWGPRTADLRPFLGPDRSDSASLDNAFELLVRSGRSLAHAKEMLIPPAWENVAGPRSRAPGLLRVPRLPDRALGRPGGHRRLRRTVEVLAAVDRNGLRPARWMVNPDLVLVASEAGVAPEQEARAIATGQLGPGETLAVDLATGEVRHSGALQRELAARRPYRAWISLKTVYVEQPFDELQDYRFDPVRLSRVFGYTAEERRLILAELAQGRLPMGSMGHDTPLAALADPSPRLAQYFHQMFAQVTNPPMDPIRERRVMSLRTYLGRRGSLLAETREHAHLMELASPIISDAELNSITGSSDPAFRSVTLPTLFPAAGGPEALAPAVASLCDAAAAAVADGAAILVLTDRDTDADRAPIPMLLAVGAVHHRLIDEGTRLHASIVVASGCPRDDHDIACLVAYGASAVNPYLAIEQVRAMAAAGAIPVAVQAAQENYRHQLGEGLLKILSKMGICTISAYRGSELFEVIGLDDEVTGLAFRHTPRRVGGFGLAHLAAAVLARHARYDDGGEEAGGFYRHQRHGPPHVFSPGAVLALHQAVRSGREDAWEDYLERVGGRGPAQLRDLITFAAREPVPLEEVEPAGAHRAPLHHRRHVAGSAEHRSPPRPRRGDVLPGWAGQLRRGRTGPGAPRHLARRRHQADRQRPLRSDPLVPGGGGGAADQDGAGSQAGRGRSTPRTQGECRDRPSPEHPAGNPPHLAPSPPRHLLHRGPGAVGRRPQDLPAQRPGLGEAGLRARRRGDRRRGGQGTGRRCGDQRPRGRHRRLPAHLHQARRVALGDRAGRSPPDPGGERHPGPSGARSRRRAAHGERRGDRRPAGSGALRLRHPPPARAGLQDGPSLPPGRLSHRDRHPAPRLAGPLLREPGAGGHPVPPARRRGAPATSRRWEPVRWRKSSGAATCCGRWTRPTPWPGPSTTSWSPSPAAPPPRRFDPPAPSPLGEALAAAAAAHAASGTPLHLDYPISNTDRAVGARLAGIIAARHPAGLPEGSITIRLTGTAGQSLGAFLVPGVHLHLEGTANDGVGKGMAGGSIAIVPRAAGAGPSHGAGNAALYGATGGRLFVAGRVGLRFAVRNSGARAVVEGCLDHGCEYMTGGTVAILGPTGHNLAAGMTGGVLFVWDPTGEAPRRFAVTSPQAAHPSPSDLDELHALLQEHLTATASPTAAAVLADWDRSRGQFWAMRPSPA